MRSTSATPRDHTIGGERLRVEPRSEDASNRPRSWTDSRIGGAAPAMTRLDQRAAIGRPRQGGLPHCAASRRSHLPSWYRETSTTEPRAGRTASHRGHRTLYLLMLRFETGLHRTRRAVPQTHFTSVRRIPCFKSLHYTCPLVQVKGARRLNRVRHLAAQGEAMRLKYRNTRLTPGPRPQCCASAATAFR
jgi:hypothetical protein